MQPSNASLPRTRYMFLELSKPLGLAIKIILETQFISKNNDTKKQS
jgi:hypothetical protein